MRKRPYLARFLPPLVSMILSTAALVPASPAEEPRWSIIGSVLESSDLNFRVSAPAGWTWSEDSAARQPSDGRYSFVARADAKTFFRFTVRGHGMTENSPRSVGEFLDGVKASSSKSGITLTDTQSSPRQSKAGAGFGYSYTMRFPNGATAFADGFILAAGRFYMLQYISTDRGKLPQFGRFISGFELFHNQSR